MSDFYYSDSYFQLELNLQETRRALIALIEACELKEFNETECSLYTEHKVKDLSKVSADLLPKPKWDHPQPSPAEYDVQTWLQMGSLKQINADATRGKKTVNFQRTPCKMAVKNMESPGKEFCLKFAQNAYNLDFIMKTNKISKTNKPALEGNITVDAFFKSFKDAKPSIKQTNMAFNDITRSPNTGSDYAYF